MAAFETRDFLGMLDCAYYSYYPAHPDSSSSSLLHFSLRPTESDCSNNAERVCAEAEAEATIAITPAPIKDSSTTSTSSNYSGNKRSAEQSVLYGGNENAIIIGQPRAILTDPLSSSSSSSSFSSSYCVIWEGLMHPLLWKGSIRPLRIPLSRKASLTRFFQKRNERVKNLRLNGRKFTSDRSAASCLEPGSSQAIDVAYPQLEPNAAYVKRQCVHS